MSEEERFQMFVQKVAAQNPAGLDNNWISAARFGWLARAESAPPCLDCAANQRDFDAICDELALLDHSREAIVKRIREILKDSVAGPVLPPSTPVLAFVREIAEWAKRHPLDAELQAMGRKAEKLLVPPAEPQVPSTPIERLCQHPKCGRPEDEHAREAWSGDNPHHWKWQKDACPIGEHPFSSEQTFMPVPPAEESH